MTTQETIDTPASRKHAYEKLRQASTWKLLSSNKAPAVLAILQTCFPPHDRRLPRSELFARVDVHLDLLTDPDRDSQMTSSDYCDNWVREGYLARRDDPESHETTFELSPATVSAIAFIKGLDNPQPTTTESRLTLVIQQLERLAEETEWNRDKRLADLQIRRQKIEREIHRLTDGQVLLPAADVSVDRLRDILEVARGLSNDFHQYRSDLRQVDLHLREQILAPEGSRGDVLQALLSGDDLLGQSQVGSTFNAFFKLLNDPVQNAHAQSVLERIMGRDFARELSHKELETLANVFSDLYQPAQEVLDVKSELYRSLARFVRSQDFQQHQLMNELLQQAQSLALSQKDDVSTRAPLKTEFELPRADMFSITQWQLKDPSDPGSPEPLARAEVVNYSLDDLRLLARQNEIDIPELRGNVNGIVTKFGQASIGDVLRHHPPTQGLGSVIGMMFLATGGGSADPDRTEMINWTEHDGTAIAARIPLFYFLDEVEND